MKKILSVGAVLFLASSCQTYQKMALEPEEILTDLNKQRQRLSNSQEMTFVQAAQIMDENNLQLEQIRKAYEGFQSIAAIKTPLPNPSLEIGAAFGSRLSGTTASSSQPFVGLGFSIPLGPRLRRNDELNQVLALKAYNEQVLQHRELYFELRSAYVSFSLSQKAMQVQAEMEANLELTKKATTKLFDIGSVTKLGLNAVEVQLARLKLGQIDTKINAQSSLSELAKLLVLEEESLRQAKFNSLPELAMQMSFDSLRSKLIRNGADLARAEMSFHLSDAELRLDLAKQYPDLNVGFSGDQEVGEKRQTFSIPFSVELPVFDRNQQAIASSLNMREQRLIRYKATMNSALTELRKLHKQYKYSFEKFRYMKETVIPLSASNLESAKKALKLGTIDILRYLDMVNAHQKMKLDLVELEQASWGLRIQLEKLCGQPLVASLDTSFPLTSLKNSDKNK